MEQNHFPGPNAMMSEVTIKHIPVFHQVGYIERRAIDFYEELRLGRFCFYAEITKFKLNTPTWFLKPEFFPLCDSRD